MEDASGGSLVCEQIERKSQAGATSLWGPQLMLSIRAGHRNPGTILTFGPFKFEYEGRLRREPRL
eukprot:8938937-Pyramimonas_sp.AAC.1